MWGKGLSLIAIYFIAVAGAPGSWVLMNLIVAGYAGAFGTYDYYLLKRKNTQWWS
jgi:hypothetical protein